MAVVVQQCMLFISKVVLVTFDHIIIQGQHYFGSHSHTPNYKLHQCMQYYMHG